MQLSFFMVLQNNKFGTFHNGQNGHLTLQPGTPQNDAADKQTFSEYILKSLTVSSLTQPFWLNPGNVRTQHCVSAASNFENIGSIDNLRDNQSIADSESTEVREGGMSGAKAKTVQNGPITRDEICVEASCLVYKIIKSILYKSRFYSRLELLQSVLYFFTGWS